MANPRIRDEANPRISTCKLCIVVGVENQGAVCLLENCYTLCWAHYEAWEKMHDELWEPWAPDFIMGGVE